MITLKAKDAIQHQILNALETAYCKIDEAILWFNGASGKEISHLCDVRDLSKVCKELFLYNSRSTKLILPLLITELEQSPDDIVKIQTSDGAKPKIPDVIKELLSKLKNQTKVLKNLSVKYERYN